MSETAPGLAKKRARDVFVIVALFALFAALTLPMFISTEDRTAAARSGTMSVATENLAQRPLLLQGQWTIARLTSTGSPRGTVIAVPGAWEGTRLPDGTSLASGEAVVYRLKLRDVSAGAYRLYVAPVWGGSRLYVDGVLRSSRGNVGLTPESSRYELLAHDVGFDTTGGEVNLAIAVSTFHDMTNGLRAAPVLGTAASMDRWIALAWAKTFYIGVSLVLIGLFALIVFVNRPVDRSTLFLALGAFALLGLEGIVGFQNLILVLLPGLPHDVVFAIINFCTYFGMMAWVAYVEALFPDSRRKQQRWYMMLQATIMLAGAIVFATHAIGGMLPASRGDYLFLICVVLVFAFLFGRAFAAMREGRDGAVLLFCGQVAVVVSVIWQGAVNLAWISPGPVGKIDFASYGLLLFAFTHLVILARRWTVAIVSAETLNDDLGRLLEVNSAVASESHLVSLLERIAGVTSRILDAERSSIFLHDPHRQELWSLVAEGMNAREIRIPDGKGIAGSVFGSGKTAHVSDPYSDPRFNPAVDRDSGFVTRNVLCTALVARDGRRLGVLQVLNSRQAPDFTARDEQRLAAFAAQAAIAIDNANLFAAVLESRNYNERILSSMSSGVITLQDDLRKARLNDSAARILGVGKDTAEAADARRFIDDANPWLADEIADVAAGEASKTYLDHELMTVGNGLISANLSLVPLRDGERATGVLMMVDDISAGKRLEGTIRRFMTQEVMDQVLSHDEDALFGSACQASVLFADIRGFTTIAEALTARETVELLNELFTELYEAVAGANGVLDKYMGDAIMAVYGAPLAGERDAANAVTSGIAMLRSLDTINARRHERGEPGVRIGIGISTGEVVAGTIGSPKRMDYTVIGDSVNLAARLQELTKTYGVELLVCENTAAAAAEHGIGMREIDVIRVRGRTQPARVFEVLSRPPADPAAHGAMLDDYRDGRARLIAQDWEGALAAFERVLARDPEDVAANVMLERVSSLADQPPGSGWDGVWQGPAKKVA